MAIFLILTAGICAISSGRALSDDWREDAREEARERWEDRQEELQEQRDEWVEERRERWEDRNERRGDWYEDTAMTGRGTTAATVIGAIAIGTTGDDTRSTIRDIEIGTMVGAASITERIRRAVTTGGTTGRIGAFTTTATAMVTMTVRGAGRRSDGTSAAALAA
jgi:hypothetical protein